MYNSKQLMNIDNPDCVCSDPSNYNTKYFRTQIEKYDIILIEISSLKEVLYNNHYYNIVLADQDKNFYESFEYSNI